MTKLKLTCGYFCLLRILGYANSSFCVGSSKANKNLAELKKKVEINIKILNKMS